MKLNKKEIITENKAVMELSDDNLGQVTGGGGFTYCGATQSEGYRNHNCSFYKPGNNQCECCYGKPLSNEEMTSITEEPEDGLGICPTCHQKSYNIATHRCMFCYNRELNEARRIKTYPISK